MPHSTSVYLVLALSNIAAYAMAARRSRSRARASARGARAAAPLALGLARQRGRAPRAARGAARRPRACRRAGGIYRFSLCVARRGAPTDGESRLGAAASRFCGRRTRPTSWRQYMRARRLLTEEQALEHADGDTPTHRCRSGSAAGGSEHVMSDVKVRRSERIGGARPRRSTRSTTSSRRCRAATRIAWVRPSAKYKAAHQAFHDDALGCVGF